MPIFSFLATFGIVLVSIVDPYSGTYANAAVAPSQWENRAVQSVLVAGSDGEDVSRDAYSVTMPAPALVVSAAAPAAGTPNPGSAKAIAKGILSARGMGGDQYNCLVALWNRESGWNVYASNGSGAYGIPQALPGSKMASAGADWATSARTQIIWGLGYIQGRYSSPCGAWAHSESSGWY